jgi:hypothetical protein
VKRAGSVNIDDMVDESDRRRQSDRRFQRVEARRPASDDNQVIALQGDPSSRAFVHPRPSDRNATDAHSNVDQGPIGGPETVD